ncbi:MAG: 3,4-dihydroxy-2-butanone-4-phosphate synthase [Phycisphaeraceae bacterium]|nr:3,4-dihydroxy-2-butanone-4-phosphate synthase [Phycisphaeraceae bacterium]
MHPIPDILAELQAGRMIVLVDDEERENEGDLVLPAQFASPQAINFMLHEARGMLCVALAGSLCARLELDPQSRINTAQRGTAYTVTVDAHEKYGITTGVSAADRATTIRLMADAQSQPSDFARPGHVQPLRAREGGVLRRTGQTEGSVDLCRLAGLQPAAAIIEIMNPDGSMARRPQLEKFCRQHQILMCSIADLIHYRLERDKLVRRLQEYPLENEAGRFKLIAYESAVDSLPHVALTVGPVGQLTPDGAVVEIHSPVLVRMHSQNLLGDVFGDLSQPSGKTLLAAMRRIHAEGCGAIVYLRHSQMGEGFLRRLQTIQLPESPDPAPQVPAIGASQLAPGLRPPTDKRDYGIGSQILRDLGIRHLRLLTNHPFTPTALAGFGLSIREFVPL